MWTVWKKQVKLPRSCVYVSFRPNGLHALIVDENKNYPHPFLPMNA